LMSSGTMADPIKPVAPVRKTRILFFPSVPFVANPEPTDIDEWFSAC
jgi:hypothetical protein